MPNIFAEILLDQNLAKRLDYSIPEEWKESSQVGMRVEVPLKGNLVKGTIAALKTRSSIPHVRPIARLLSTESELSDAQWALAHWMSRYYMTPLQRVLKCFIPPNVRKDVQAKTQVFLTLAISKEEALRECERLRTKAPQIASALEAALQWKKGCWAASFAKEENIPKKTIDQLIKQKIFASKKMALGTDLLLNEEFFLAKPKTLNDEQAKCLKAISQSLSTGVFASHLLHGVTGSGKTEIYLQAIQMALDQGKGAILLVPEVSLTSQTIERFRSRFLEKIAVLHHKRSLGERSHSWTLLRTGEIRIAVGARSAVFAPMKNLGLIIVDEEHDSSYKQSDEIPCYHARNIAVMRSHLEKAVVVLGSATPSIESRYNADIGKYQLHTLNARAASAKLPSIRIIDMKEVYLVNGGFTHFSGELIDAIQTRIQKGEQTLLFLNKRGYHRLQICAFCRNIVKCPHCDLALTFHKQEEELRCHLCSYQQKAIRKCPSCQSTDPLEFKGFGTEHVERSLHALFPSIRTLRMDRDTTHKKDSHEELFKQFRAHKADVLIGTQMIAKGFHFPSVTLVGVLNPDAMLHIPDFRSTESTFQLLTQVAGRSGRSELAGEVILQTFLPHHPIIQLAASQDYSSFYKTEIEERRMFGYPPFTHFIKILFTSNDLETATTAAHKAHAYLVPLLPLQATALAPSPSGHAKIKDLHRIQFLIKTPRIEPLIALLTELPSFGAQIKIDVDPLSTFF
ncbi:MAG: primosomal protein N' [Chlamydiia bacterium]|nr:primosomal protein N' [Chlamydiia bacterium]